MKYITKKDLKIPTRKKNAKKGDSGKVLIVGGSQEYVGALALAGHAALRSGCDWVTVAAPEKVAWAINCLSADLVTKKFRGKHFSLQHANAIISLSKKYDAVLVGNGIGLKSKSFVKKIVKEIKKPMVIDADALKGIKIQEANNAILTPHKKEFETLLKNSKTTNVKKSLKNNILILKEPVDKIITKNKTHYNKTGNAGMAKAGTGDVLAGLAAGFLAQGLSLEQAAINATYINGKLGDLLLKKKKGYSFIASDLIDEIKRFL